MSDPIYTDPDDKRWRLLENGIPRQPKIGEHSIGNNGHVTKWFITPSLIGCIVEPIEPRRLVFEIERREPTAGEHYLFDGASGERTILRANHAHYSARDVLVLVEGDMS